MLCYATIFIYACRAIPLCQTGTRLRLLTDTCTAGYAAQELMDRWNDLNYAMVCLYCQRGLKHTRKVSHIGVRFELTHSMWLQAGTSCQRISICVVLHT